MRYSDVLSGTLWVIVVHLVLTCARQQTLVVYQGMNLETGAVERDSYIIFNELNSLLRQWGNALAPNGYSVTLASIPANTLLYHARTDANEPSSPEWLAFDVEMSYGIYGGRRNTSVFLRTYQTTSKLGPLLYFNGLSAALTPGTQDAQDLLAPPPDTTNSTTMPNPFGEYARAKRLCAWASERGVEGFVRTNAGFEVMWCDMRSDKLKPVRNMDVTRWADDMDDHSDRRGSDEDGERHGPGGPRRPGFPPPPPPPEDREGGLSRFGDDSPQFPHRPGPGGPRGPMPGRMFAQYASWEWLRAASHTYDGLGEARVQLHSAWHVTSRGMSGPDTITRMAELSAETIDAWREDVDVMLQMAAEGTREGAGVDWRALTDVVVARYGDRLPQLAALLKLACENAEPYQSPKRAPALSINATAHLQHAYRLVSSLVLPFFDREASTEEQVETCTHSISPDLTAASGEADPLNSYERKLWTAIIHVHRAICTVLVDTHTQLAAIRSSQSTSGSFEAVTSRADELIAQLDWSIWVRCPEVCQWGQVCFVPIWPLFGFGTWNHTRGSSRPKPQCVGNSVDSVAG